MLRGTLITAVYSKATNIAAVAKDNKASITLMSTDVELTIRGLIDLHEMWANVVQVAIATWLLEIELGAACVGPVIIALGRCLARSIKLVWYADCRVAATGTTVWFSGYTASFQLRWVEKVQARIGEYS
jgi:ATP-binding cassette subfamily C (CFTR/MRP) protein 1